MGKPEGPWISFELPDGREIASADARAYDLVWIMSEDHWDVADVRLSVVAKMRVQLLIDKALRQIGNVVDDPAAMAKSMVSFINATFKTHLERTVAGANAGELPRSEVLPQ